LPPPTPNTGGRNASSIALRAIEEPLDVGGGVLGNFFSLPHAILYRKGLKWVWKRGGVLDVPPLEAKLRPSGCYVPLRFALARLTFALSKSKGCGASPCGLRSEA
jgi:hypothetical protein